MPLLDLTDTNFDELIEKYPRVLIDFWAPWCGPCKSFAPVFEAAAEAYPDVLFARVNTEVEKGLAEAFEVRSIPTILSAKDGTVVGVKLGALAPAALAAMIAELG